MAYEKPSWWVRSVFNPLAMATGVSGTCTLVSAGRRSGEARKIPVVPIEHQGARYVVSVRGESEWVRNTRTSGILELQCKRGSSGRFRAVEVPVDQREAIIAAYRAKTGRAVEGHWRKLPDAADHPTFRLEPAAT